MLFRHSPFRLGLSSPWSRKQRGASAPLPDVQRDIAGRATKVAFGLAWPELLGQRGLLPMRGWSASRLLLLAGAVLAGLALGRVVVGTTTDIGLRLSPAAVRGLHASPTATPCGECSLCACRPPLASFAPLSQRPSPSRHCTTTASASSGCAQLVGRTPRPQPASAI
jgi:hypothetical protein